MVPQGCGTVHADLNYTACADCSLQLHRSVSCIMCLNTGKFSIRDLAKGHLVDAVRCRKQQLQAYPGSLPGDSFVLTRFTRAHSLG